MFQKKNNLLFVAKKLSLYTLLISSYALGHSFGKPETDNWYAFSGMFKPEMFYGKNINMLNNCNKEDRSLYYFRHTLDLKLDTFYGKETYGHNILFSRFGLRNRSIWGDPRSIGKTGPAEIKTSGTTFGKHNHYIPRLIFWMREAWLEMDLNEILNLHTLCKHNLTLGAFSFKLGRGIALGDAYSVGPEVLGFYTEAAVDQYAFGSKLHGKLIEDRLSYDLYVALLDSKTASLSDTAARILGQEYGHRKNPERGCGKLNYVVAGRLNWHALHNDTCSLFLEPYWLYYDQPEQKVEFFGDARSKLGTLGIAGDIEIGQFVGGFDCALNLGEQSVKGWDRNQIKLTNVNGALNEVNDQVKYQNKNNPNDPRNGKDYPYVPGSAGQKIIENSPQNEQENGVEIGTATFDGNEITLVNSQTRFRDPYKNKFNGWMFVMDAGWWNKAKDLQVATTFGWASGDNNPNEIHKDGTYSGFIGLQEIYSGKLVKSAFILGGSGKVKRPLALPLTQPTGSRFARAVSRFTNLGFTGAGINWKPNRLCGKLKFNPTTLFYWQDMAVPAYDWRSGQEKSSKASRFLGTEFNLFMDYYLKPPLRFFAVGAVFIPGTHFKDILGKPITSAQSKIIAARVKQWDNPDRTGFQDESIPNIGDDSAFTFNIGLEYKF